MPEPRADGNLADPIDVGRNRQSRFGMPRWLKVSAFTAVAMVVLFVVMMAATGGRDRQAPNDDGAGDRGGHNPIEKAKEHVSSLLP